MKLAYTQLHPAALPPELIHIQEEENQSTTGRGSKALMVYIPARDVSIFIDLLKRINFATSNKWSQSIEIISIDFNSNLVRLTFGVLGQNLDFLDSV